ncbi:MAG: GH1 family beta-glucosidase [Rhizobiaceae bacterium]
MSKMGFSRADFPKGFLFGAATSSYQIEGNAAGGCGPCHWDSYAATPGNVARGENGAVACDHYHRFPHDIALMAECGLDAYRFSIAWPRVLPEGRGKANEAGLDFYDRLVDELCTNAIKPFSTLYHWDLPQPLADIGGWRNRDVASLFADYADLVMRRIGDRVHAAATFNEPWCIAWLGHFMGRHAPGLRDIRAAAHAMHHVLLAHGNAVSAMRAIGQQNVGVVMNLEPVLPASDNPADVMAAARFDALYNRWFLEAVFKGHYPQEALEGLGPHMPAGYLDDMAVISQPVEWLGVNYYSRRLAAAEPGALWPAWRDVDGPLPKTGSGWEIYPQGLGDLIARIDSQYTNGLPIHITENGMASPDLLDQGQVNDAMRIDYIDGHVAVVGDLIRSGFPIQSYFVWSLLDNFEWSSGYGQRFGLVHIDFATLERTPKASWHALKEALAR